MRASVKNRECISKSRFAETWWLKSSNSGPIEKDMQLPLLITDAIFAETLSNTDS